MPLARLLIILLSVVLAGCQPGAERTVDEQKEPYFLAAKKRAQDKDFPGAIEYFEKALDVNPRSASAHFELGILYEQQQFDYAAALYHYQRAVSLRPDHAAADIINQHIEQCKRELAKTVVQLPSMEAMQRRLETLTADNEDLRRRLQAWENYYHGRGVTMLSNTPVLMSNSSPATVARQERRPQPSPAAVANATTSSSPAPRPAVAASSRMHTVAAGETLGLIARRYGVKVAAVQAANPSLDARRLRPGQTVVIPAGSP